VVLGNRSDRDRDSALALGESGRFDDIVTDRIPWRQSYDTSRWLAFLHTHSDHHTLPVDRRDRLLNAVGEAIDELGGMFEVEYETVLVSARRL
jgi:hypothetical protein